MPPQPTGRPPPRRRAPTISSEPRALYDEPRLYDLLCPRLAPGDPELDYWLALCAGAGRVLELGCGTGRVTLPLAAAGVDVVGVDVSAAMLARARTAAASAGLTVDLRLQDMRALDLEAAGPFGLVFIPFNTLGHLRERTDLEAALAGVARHLAPRGRLAISVFNPDPRTLGRPRRYRVPLAEPIWDAAEGRHLRAEETLHYDHASQTSGARIHFRWDDGPDVFVGDADLRCYYPRELDALLHYNGWTVIERRGDFAGTPFTSDSPLQNLVCVRTRR